MRNTTETQGNTYNQWTAARFSHVNERGELYWFYFCSCGTTRPVCSRNVQMGLSTNCGCVRKKGLSEKSKTHGLAKTPIYNSWAAMKGRCDRPSDVAYQHYGGRGITYCAEWKTFEGFLSDMQATWRKGLSIERIDSNGNYEPSNCRWATVKEQSRNKRSNVLVVCPDGATRVLKEASELYGIPYITLYSRVVTLAWPEAEWFKPVRRRAAPTTQIEGETK